VTEAAEEIRAAADPEANIIFGTSFNDRLGDEVMITVIATGFDGGRRRQARQEGAQATTDGSTSIRAPRERDFLEELQRQREETGDSDEAAARLEAEPAAAAVRTPEPVAVKRPSAYDADDLEIPSFLRRK